jgi:hypothetical protein
MHSLGKIITSFRNYVSTWCNTRWYIVAKGGYYFTYFVIIRNRMHSPRVKMHSLFIRLQMRNCFLTVLKVWFICDHRLCFLCWVLRWHVFKNYSEPRILMSDNHWPSWVNRTYVLQLNCGGARSSLKKKKTAFTEYCSVCTCKTIRKVYEEVWCVKIYFHSVNANSISIFKH